jgi:hypothetical protein
MKHRRRERQQTFGIGLGLCHFNGYIGYGYNEPKWFSGQAVLKLFYRPTELAESLH